MAETADRKSLHFYEAQLKSNESDLSKCGKKAVRFTNKKNAFFVLILIVIAFWIFEQLASINTSSRVTNSADKQEFNQVSVSINPGTEKSINFQMGTAQKYYRQGQFMAAQDILQQILILNKEHLQARLLLASSLLEQDQKRDAIKIYTEGFRDAPKEPHLAQPLAKLLEEEGKIDLAIKVLLHAAPSNKSDPEYYALIATLQQKIGQHKNVIEIYQNILQVRPENRQWWLSLGISLLAETRKVEAREAFEMSLQDNTLSPALTSFAYQRINELKHS